ncbi:response regulator transcription factor [Antarcticibacterium flavum]|uniref:Response regulator transcription factor n=1 Tax=Antarcticibacterium flavum TaxID=2058175 RepID=A0A5B7X0Q1_9FLAO|nr:MULTISPECIES: response regulator transcription factor [Antarcticibacterium]MCM4160702.1 DNA-binding response regulator [Antarcticibacterium sp. W02-3]QCY68820.1 response regulator transcription factor [Antarcticibacterium flavum]
MFKKVLVAEDMDSVNHAVGSVLDEFKIPLVAHAQYCDQAFLLAKKAILDNEPFDLLICDLSFKSDHRVEKITSGKELIEKIKLEDPNIKVIVNSIEDHPHTVKSLWETGYINAYVCKDRRGLSELKEAILQIKRGKSYNSPRIERSLKQENLITLDPFEVTMLKCVSQGLTQDEIREKFLEQNISPNSKSAIEKRLKELRENFNARTTPHLISIVKDLKLI